MTPAFCLAERERLWRRIAEEEARLANARAQAKPNADTRRFIRHRMGDLALLRSGLARVMAEAPVAFDDD